MEYFINELPVQAILALPFFTTVAVVVFFIMYLATKSKKREVVYRNIAIGSVLFLLLQIAVYVIMGVMFYEQVLRSM